MAAAVYRWVVLFSILYFLNIVFEPYGLKVLGQLIALMALYGLIVMPFWKLYKYFKVPGRLGKVKRWRLLSTIAVATALVAGVMSIPLPSYVYSDLVVHPRNAESVVVKVDGVLEEIPEGIEPGATVEKGQVLAKLRNMPLESSILQLEGEREILLERLAGRASMKLADNPAERAAAQRDIAAIQKRLESVNSQLVVQREDLERLTIRAPRDGVIIPPEIVPQPKSGQDDLPKWWGTPFNERNRGATLQTGTKLCSIGDPTKLEARLLIEQSRSSEVQANQEVLVQLQQSPWHRYRTKIVDTEGDEIPVAPSRLSSMTGGPLPTEMNDAGVPVPLTPHFYAFAPLPNDGERLRVGLVGKGKITTPPKTLYQRLESYAARTFNFEL